MRNIRITETITSRDSKSLVAFLREIGKYDVLSIDEEAALAQRIQQGDRSALDELVAHNLRFVVSVAKQSQGYGLPLGDLIAEGCIGLITAAERFDVTRGFKFCTYAVWWIRQAVMKAIGEYASMMRLPVNQRYMMTKVNSIKNKFETEYSREPTEDELAELVGVTPDKLPSYDTIGRVVTSIDAPLNNDDDCCLIEMLSDTSQKTDSGLERESLRFDLSMALKRLSARERSVLVMLFGLDGKDTRTLDEVASLMDLSRERVRQVRDGALKHISENPYSVAELKKYCA